MEKKDPLALNLDPITSTDSAHATDMGDTAHSENQSSQPNPVNNVTQPTEAKLNLTQAFENTKGQSSQAIDHQLTSTLLKELIRLLQPKPFRKRHPILFWGFFIILGIIGYNMFFSVENIIPDTDRIAVVQIKGAISEVDATLKWVETLKKDQSVKGVLLRIDSPGGSVGASQELYYALEELGQSKPVVASLGTTAASGGLMVAMAAKHIVANPSTITGSIGVRMDIPQIYKLLQSLGISQETLVTGKFKDAASMMRELTPDDRRYLQGILQNLYDQFVELIAKSRNLTLDEVQKMADGRIFTGLEAQKLRLVDSLGGQNIALAKLRELTGVSEETPLYNRPKDMGELYGDFFKNSVNFILNSLQSHGAGNEFVFQ